MVITKLIGGLGNQMFQYAAGRSLAISKGTQLLLDVAGFANYGLHQGFELGRVFSCQADLADEADLRKVLGWQSSAQIRSLLSRSCMELLRNKSLVIEPHFQFWPVLKTVQDDCYLSGYWQSEKYFAQHALQIHADFAFRSTMDDENTVLAEQIGGVNAVSLHVRRGDYATNATTTATYGLCTLEYYRAAVIYVAERVEQPFFFIFSDDIDWVKENLMMDYPCQYVNHNHGAQSYNDMRLMSMCRHHIIANSSFSWWGAWLNPNTDKIIVAPTHWFANQTNVRDLFPQGWVTL